MRFHKVQLQKTWAFTNSGALVPGSTAMSRESLALQTEAALKLIDTRFKVSTHDALIAKMRRIKKVHILTSCFLVLRGTAVVSSVMEYKIITPQ